VAAVAIADACATARGLSSSSAGADVFLVPETTFLGVTRVSPDEDAVMYRPCLASNLIAIAALAFASRAAAFVVYKVGGDADCPYSSIQDAIDAAAANPGTDYVWIAMNKTYSGQQVVITDQDVLVEGGFTDCDDIDIDTAQTNVSGAGNGGGAVFSVRGTSNVYFSNLFITGASRDGDASGGGIDFDGVGSLDIHESTIGLNSAGYGGGMNIKGDGGHVDVVVENDMIILNNTAYTSGGGIRIEGDTTLHALQPRTLIEGNHALGGYGGGIEVLGPADAEIGSPGYGTLPVIYFNDAQYGGGIAVLAPNEDNFDAHASFFTTDAANAVQISSNSASIRGGAIYLKPFTQHIPANVGLAGICISDFRVNDNIAPEGAAIYADFDSDVSGRNIGSDVSINEGDECNAATLGAVPCAPDIPCNEISQNIAEDGNSAPTDGAVILVDSTSSLNGNRFSLRNNTAAYGINLVGANDDGYGNGGIANCLFADNHLQHEVIGLRRTESTTFAVGRCTLANNTIDNGYALYANENATFSFANSIVDMPGVQTLDYAGESGNLNLGYILSNDVSTLAVDTAIEGEPTFVDAANGDYHLQPLSLGVDFAPGVGGTDLDRRTRTVDLPEVLNTYGALDLGAYEIQIEKVLGCANADTIYCDGFDPQ